MKLSFATLGLVFALLFTGCEQSKFDKTENEQGISKEQSLIKTDNAIEDRKLIKNGDIDFKTTDFVKTRQQILEAVKMHKGYIGSDKEYSSRNRKSNSLVVRIPTANFDEFLAEATQGIEQFDNKVINVKDVTEEFLDVAARLKTKKELELRYFALLKQTKNVEEIMAIEKEIEALRSQIESIEGRLKYLENRVSFSTVNFSFYQVTLQGSEFGQKFSDGFINGWKNVVWFFIALVNIWPFVVIATGAYFGLRYYWRKN